MSNGNIQKPEAWLMPHTGRALIYDPTKGTIPYVLTHDGNGVPVPTEFPPEEFTKKDENRIEWMDPGSYPYHIVLERLKRDYDKVFQLSLMQMRTVLFDSTTTPQARCKLVTGALEPLLNDQGYYGRLRDALCSQEDRKVPPKALLDGLPLDGRLGALLTEIGWYTPSEATPTDEAAVAASGQQ
jgi:hypothetical protein